MCGAIVTSDIKILCIVYKGLEYLGDSCTEEQYFIVLYTKHIKDYES